MLAPRAASQGTPLGPQEQPAGGDRVVPDVWPQHTLALAVAAEIEGQHREPGSGGLLTHQGVVLLAAAGAVAREPCSAWRTIESKEQTGQLKTVAGDRDARGRPGVLGSGRPGVLRLAGAASWLSGAVFGTLMYRV